jgi:hypothetical protein
MCAAPRIRPPGFEQCCCDLDAFAGTALVKGNQKMVCTHWAKRTSPMRAAMSANDPKRTSSVPGVSDAGAFGIAA